LPEPALPATYLQSPIEVRPRPREEHFSFVTIEGGKKAVLFQETVVKALVIGSTALLAFALPGCSEKSQDQAAAAGDHAAAAAQDAGAATATAAGDAGRATERAAANAGTAVNTAAENSAAAGRQAAADTKHAAGKVVRKTDAAMDAAAKTQ